MMDVFGKREPIIRAVASEYGVNPQLLLDLLALEQEFPSLHTYGAKPRMRRAAEKLIDEAFGQGSNPEHP